MNNKFAISLLLIELITIAFLALVFVLRTNAKTDIFDQKLNLPIILRNYCAGMFADDFSNPSSGWPQVDDEELTLEYRRFVEKGISSNLIDKSRYIEAIDLDDDGDIDLITPELFSQKIVWWENNGDGQFDDQILIRKSNTEVISAIDLDGDSDIDIVGGYWGLFWYENDGQENFIEHTIAKDIHYLNDIKTVDLDQDNDVDLLTASESLDAILWWENAIVPTGNGWIQHVIREDIEFARSIYPIDLDLDYDIDLLGAASGESTIMWWENDGTPEDDGWVEHSLDGPFPYSREVSGADLDNDGDSDVIGVAAEPTGIVWWENDGSPNDGGWLRHTIDNDFPDPRAVKTADLDHDQDQDIIGISSYAEDIYWWENELGTSFIGHTVTETPRTFYGINVAEINGDESLDFVGVSRGEYEIKDISLFYNQPEYRIHLKQHPLWLGVRPKVKVSDATIEVDVRNPYETVGSYGLIFGLSDDWSQFYTFEITSDSQFMLWRFSSTSGWKRIYSGSSIWIKPGIATNHLKVERNSEFINAFANDQLLVSVKEDAFTGMRRAGLTVSASPSSGLDVRFDNFIVTPLDCGGGSIISLDSRQSEEPPTLFYDWEIMPIREGS